MPLLIRYKDSKGKLLRDRIGRLFGKIVGAVEDRCLVCKTFLYNKNNEGQVVLYCGKVCRSKRHELANMVRNPNGQSST